jgi:hypothetical protein
MSTWGSSGQRLAKIVKSCKANHVRRSDSTCLIAVLSWGIARGDFASSADIASIYKMVHILAMRTSVTLDDDVYELASLYSRGKGITLGAAIGELVRRGEAASPEASSEIEIAFSNPAGE